MKNETEVQKEEIICIIRNELDKAQNLLTTIPEKDQRFSWQNIANLRGMLREGPNKSGRTIDLKSWHELQAIIYDLDLINSQMKNWLAAKPINQTHHHP